MLRMHILNTKCIILFIKILLPFKFNSHCAIASLNEVIRHDTTFEGATEGIMLACNNELVNKCSVDGTKEFF